MNNLLNETKASIIKWGENNVSLIPQEIPYFFEELTNLDIHTLDDLEFEFQEIADYTIEGAPDNLPVSVIKNKIKLLRLVYTTINASVDIMR